MRQLLYGLLALALVACNTKDDDQFKADGGTYAFKQSEIIVNTSETDSFRLEAYYIDEPDASLRGTFKFRVNEELSTPDWKHYFVVVPFGYMIMEEAEDGTFFSDISIWSDKVDKEVVVVLDTFLGYNDTAIDIDGNSPINELTIYLRPTE